MREKMPQQLQLLRESLHSGSKPGNCFMGFDGFTDEILAAVDQRQSPKDYIPMKAITQLGERITQAAGKSCNIELIPLRRKIGGNGPIMAQGLAKMGHHIRYAGAVGSDKQIEALFQPLAQACQAIYPLAASGYSEALEFQDGKVIFGRHRSLLDVGYQTLIEQIGSETLENNLEHCELFASLNWTMLPLMTDLWQKLWENIIPSLTRKPRWMFIDLADPAKRSTTDLESALEQLKVWNTRFRVVLGVNTSEVQQLAQVCGIPVEGEKPEQLKELACRLRSFIDIEQLLVHSPRFAIASWKEGSVLYPTLFCESPTLTTGAGDNFNAGYCHGLLHGLPPDLSLLSGMATAGHYIRQGASPSPDELSLFLENWEPESPAHM